MMTADERDDCDEDDVPIRVDFRDAATARAWIEDTRVRRPYRPRFFAAFCKALTSTKPLRILELGSGPGQLAREILVHCEVRKYVALDFSPAMHVIATEYLGELASRVTFETRDFRERRGLTTSDSSTRSSRCRPRTRRVTSAIWCRCSSGPVRAARPAVFCSTPITT